MQLARQQITALLEQAIGLKASALGVATLERAIRSRMRATESMEVDSYLEILSVSRMELRSLVEEVVVPETWFFRDQEPFIFLARYLANSGKDLLREFVRILSLPCATGEEPFSIAMTLLLAGTDPSSFFIDAVDVSERVLARARLGIFRENSFRTKDLSFREEFFTRTDEGYVLQKEVRDKVRFLQGNIIQSDFMSSLGLYDVVFCRNVLIYFNEEAQRQSIDSLHRILLPGGILFTGHAEAGLFYNSQLFSVAHAKAFAFRRQEQRSAAERGREESSSPALSRSSLEQSAQEVPPRIGSVSTGGEDEEFALVRSLADEGRLEEAAMLSEEHLHRYGPSSEWYYLLGVIRDSQGRPEDALKLLRKALYLDPGNEESLIHLALLAERVGDLDSAANYKRRARNLREGGTDQCREKR